MANLKKMSDEQKSFFAQEISVSAVNVTTSINDTMNRKFNQLNNRLNEIDIRVNESKTFSRKQYKQIRAIRRRKEDYKIEVRRIFQKDQLEELVDDQINQNACSTLIICGVKFNLCNEKSWNDTENVLATTP